jgi:uncharacterized protein YdiU (UPF0061 family)
MKPAAYKWNLAVLHAIAPQKNSDVPYSSFHEIDGSHPWKYAVPNGFIEYQARILRRSKVVYFNFQLAKEMGLIAKDHPAQLTKDLEKTLVETFALRIINEYDQLTGATFPVRDIKPNRYMATRYLQLQHNCKKGGTSGDGRSIWNGQFVGANGHAWDISSCGTGVTRLSPGAVHEGRPVQTGDKKVSYASGLADVDEGLTAAILSESFQARGIHTERTLVILEDQDGQGINVRAAKNLLRPSHMFLHLKQGNQLMAKSALDFYIAKQIHNRDWAPMREGDKYQYFLDDLSRRYAEFAAQIEDQYIFCWLDWDGDNMLMPGGIIDYGSIRQFGLCHHRYRYDDVDRFSTNLKEQRQKARYLVQTFLQLVDFVRTGRKQQLQAFANDPALALFDKTFDQTLTIRLLRRLGLSSGAAARVIKHRPELAREFERAYRFFERQESDRGMKRTPDGINNPAVFCTRTLLRELPKQILLQEHELDTAAFVGLMRTKFLTKKAERNSKRLAPAVSRFQRLYLDIIRFAHKDRPLKRAMLEVAMRAGNENHTQYATGDAIIYVVDYLLARRRELGRNEFMKVVDAFICFQQSRPYKGKLRKRARRILATLAELVYENKHSI